MMLERKINFWVKKTWSYLKDYRFSSILVKYFAMLFLCLALPMTVLNIWYGRVLRENTQQELLHGNEASLLQASGNMNSAILSMKNLAYTLSQDGSVQYLSSKSSVTTDRTDNLTSLQKALTTTQRANKYVDSVCIWLKKSDVFVTGQGVASFEDYQDNACIETYTEDMPARISFQHRKRNGVYPYLLTILYPVDRGKNGNAGAIVINIDIERLGDYLGSGRYKNRDDSPVLLVFSEETRELIYSDEYRLLKEDKSLVEELKQVIHWEDDFSEIHKLWGKRYMISGTTSEDDFFYVYLNSIQQLDAQNKAVNQLFVNMIILAGGMCLLLSCILAVWVYRPIRKTVELLDDASLLVDWDKKVNMDEMEFIQRSILMAKQEKEDLNEQIRERMISLHNAQICALQTQINPHFLYNSLESIGNAAVLLHGGENKVTDAIYTLGKLMRISLAGENYLVPVAEELEHVQLYIKLMDFRYRGRINMHMELIEDLKTERIVKLTLQPLIENAIEHGLAKKRSGGNIWVRGEKKGDINFIYVMDDGQGIRKQELELLKKSLQESVIGGSRHIGLRNVNQRLKLVFGDDYGLDVSVMEKGGTCITVYFRTL